MDAFFASVEQAANPKLKAQPVIVGSRANKKRTVVAACSYPAKAKGVTSGMSTQEALRLCPQAVFIPADCPKYIYTAQRILALLQEFSPQTEMASIDEFNLDITGCERIFGSWENMAYLIKQKIHQQFDLTGSIGIAPNKLMAKLAAKMNKPDGLLIWKKSDLPGVLENLPVEKLCGIGPKITLYLNQMSIFTCGQLSRAEEDLLVSRFGQYGRWLKQTARGEGQEQIELSSQPEALPKSVGHSYTLETNITSLSMLQAWIRLLCEMVALRLRGLLLQGQITHLYLRGPNLNWWSRQKKFSGTTFDGQVLYRRCLLILQGLLPLNCPVRALGVSVSGLTNACALSLFVEDRKRQELLSALDRINGRFGDWSIYPASLKRC